MISEKANVRMQAALHAIRPDEVPLPPSLAAVVEAGWTEHPSGDYALQEQDIPRCDEVSELLGLSLTYARECLLAADRPVTALFTISEPHGGVIPVTTKVTFSSGAPDVMPGFEDAAQPLMLLSTAETEFLYACDDEQAKIMSDTVEALTASGMPREEATARVNAFWRAPSRRYSLLYGGWIGHTDGGQWARAIIDG